MRRQFRGRIALKCASALAAMIVIVLGTPALALASTAGSGQGPGPGPGGPGPGWGPGQPVQVLLACPRPHAKPAPPGFVHRKFVHFKRFGRVVRIGPGCRFPKGCPPPPVAVRLVCRPGKGCPPVTFQLACRVPRIIAKGCPPAVLRFDMASGSSTLTEASGPVLAPPEQFTYNGQTYTIMTVNPGGDSFTVFQDGALFVNNGATITGGIGYLACTTGPFGS
jgi:hypothetical protein